MVTNNKVLTVSYGTFSCTLEGFDDSFDTMKAIAEYFRDLAADDRYFGAEPPTPDAEMLTRIAEREVERRVQARHEAGAIVLSTQPPAAHEVSQETTAQEQAPAEQPSMDATQDTPVEDLPVENVDVEAAQPELADEVLAEVTDEVVAEEVVQDVETDAATDDVADIAYEAADAPAQPEISDILHAVSEELSDEPAEEAAEDMASAEEFFAVSEGAVADYSDPIEDTFEDVGSEEDTINLFDDAFAETANDGEEETAAEDSIAAKLRRIRAVVSRAESSDDSDDDYIEDQHADLTAPIDLGDDAPVAEAEVAEEPVAVAEDDEEHETEVEAAAPVAETPKPRARVIRMKRSQLEDVVAEEEIEAIDEAPLAEPEVEESPVSTLSDEDEADLMAELAEVDAELSVDEPAEEAPAAAEAAPEDMVASTPVEDETPRRKKRRERRAKLDAQLPEDEAVDRLIEEANTKLDEPEGRGRRSAIAHLRAAVAATKAEKEAGKSFEKEDTSGAYRDDLAEAVKPRRSAPPLKLVAEQRIDAPEEPKSRGIRPRRVSVDAAAVEANEASSNFIEFAENMGATQLPEVLEAAASYLTFVEGRKKFSRPMLMRLAYQVGDERFEREAGLRSFGQLLRDKKIEKLAGGRFTVSEAISFKPDDRAAG